MSGIVTLSARRRSLRVEELCIAARLTEILDGRPRRIIGPLLWVILGGLIRCLLAILVVGARLLSAVLCLAAVGMAVVVLAEITPRVMDSAGDLSRSVVTVVQLAEAILRNL